VSGGSILGAYYYLKLRNLLQEKEDGTIGRQDYIDVIQEIATDFVKFVGTDVRTRLFTNPIVELKVLLGNYTHTQHLGAILDAELYSRVTGDRSGTCWLNGLEVTPRGSGSEKHPLLARRDNWRRRAKVPSLFLNATTLNTGHLWQFGITYMGEPAAMDLPMDLRERLRQFYYYQGPVRFTGQQLGYAVAISAAVPGIFEPGILRNCYPGRTIRLVDGGVYDNQGVETLMLQSCNVLFVSDCSGPVFTERNFGGGRIASSVRSNSIAMSLVRDNRYRILYSIKISGRSLRLHWVHLQKDLGAPMTIDPVDVHYSEPVSFQELTSYGPRIILEKLAALRTDLDTFSQAEADALMTIGYRMMEKSIPDCQTSEWGFLAIEPIMMNAPGYERAHKELVKLLEAGSETLFKTWRLVPPLRGVTKSVGCLVLVALLYIGYAAPNSNDFVVGISMRTIAVFLCSFAGLSFLLDRGRKYLNFDGTTSQMMISVATILFGWIFRWVHLAVFDRAFKRLGSMRRLHRLSTAK
jgi:hypothetical protein